MKRFIPLVVLKPLATSLWKHDDYCCSKFASCLEVHRQQDVEEGLTCLYDLKSLAACDNEYLTPAEFAPMVVAGAVPAEFHDGDNGVNQHWLHSLEQFYAIVSREWLAHVERTEALIGTPAGTIWRDRK